MDRGRHEVVLYVCTFVPCKDGGRLVGIRITSHNLREGERAKHAETRLRPTPCLSDAR